MADPTNPSDLVLVSRIAVEYGRVRWDLRRRTLKDVVTARRLGTARPEDPRRLSRAVTKVLGLSQGDRARCIHRALVLQRMLARQGVASDLVIGLPPDAKNERAHAWVEVDGRDMGPAPGRGRHHALARYAVTA